LLEETERLTLLTPDGLLELNVSEHRKAVNELLLKTSELVRTETRHRLKNHSKHRKALDHADLIGADLRKADLRGANLRGAYLIAADLRGNDLSGADFIGADFRDTNIEGADLSRSIFLTQAQINAAKGNSSTKLPSSLIRPGHWSV
jgi:uncharacterized protein YjbI with pentapeptide repeats